MIDVGGASSRPARAALRRGRGRRRRGRGAARVVAGDRRARGASGARVSIDTTSAAVARAALDAGARIVNDVSCAALAASCSTRSREQRRRLRADAHPRRGRGGATPTRATRDVVADVVDELRAAVERARRARHRARAGSGSIPGSASPRPRSNRWRCSRALHAFASTGLRVLCGPSRKGFIAELAPRASGARPPPAEREPGTLAAVTARGAAGRARGARARRGRRRARPCCSREAIRAPARCAHAERALPSRLLAFFARDASLVLWDLADIALVAFVLYYVLLLIKGTRAMQMGVGLRSCSSCTRSPSASGWSRCTRCSTRLLDLARADHRGGVPARHPARADALRPPAALAPARTALETQVIEEVVQGRHLAGAEAHRRR